MKMMKLIKSVTIQIEAIYQLFPAVIFIMLYTVILAFESVDNITNCNNSDESY